MIPNASGYLKKWLDVIYNPDITHVCRYSLRIDGRNKEAISLFIRSDANPINRGSL